MIRRASLQLKVTTVAIVAVAAVLAVASAALVVLHRNAQIDSLDDRIAARAELLAESPATAGSDGGDDLFVVLDASGAVVATNADEDELAELATLAGAGDHGTSDVDGDAVRYVVERHDDATAVVAGDRDDVDESVSELTRLLLWIIPLAVVLLGALVWLVVGRTLRPVERMRAEVDQIGLTELDRRVPQPPGRDEIARLATTMNAMLDRLQAAAEAQGRFVADASHELRTPLARMRAELEVDESAPDRADPAATRHSQLEEIATLQRLVDDLLVLARSDAGAVRRTSPVDLGDVVLDEAARRAPTDGGIVIGTDGVGDARVDGVESELRRVVANLLDNAVRYARSTVTITLHRADASTVLVVADDGPGIPVERRNDVFQRFTRLDASRTASTGGTGLGLAIVRDLVARHGGTVTVDEAQGGGARFIVEIPTTDALASGRA